MTFSRRQCRATLCWLPLPLRAVASALSRSIRWTYLPASRRGALSEWHDAVAGARPRRTPFQTSQVPFRRRGPAGILMAPASALLIGYTRFVQAAAPPHGPSLAPAASSRSCRHARRPCAWLSCWGGSIRRPGNPDCERGLEIGPLERGGSVAFVGLPAGRPRHCRLTGGRREPPRAAALTKRGAGPRAQASVRCHRPA